MSFLMMLLLGSLISFLRLMLLLVGSLMGFLMMLLLGSLMHELSNDAIYRLVNA